MRKSRDRFVREAFFDILKSYSCGLSRLSTEEAICILMDHPAPRFFVSFHTARRMVSLMIRGIKPKGINQNKLMMYQEILRRYIQAGGDGTQYKILEKIIQQPAPSLYVNRSTMRSIVYRSLKNKF